MTKSPAFAATLLLSCAVVAMGIANSPLAPLWNELWHIELAVELGPWQVHNTLLHWINDGLMALFFFTVGLELKREFIAGSLSSVRKALVPLVAALGGMAVPALIFWSFNQSGPTADGWGIPMATDIAFVVGVMTLLGPRIPLSVKVFVTALAIADDLGAVLVIAFFYTSQIDLVNVGTGLFFLLLLIGANALGVRKPLFYGLVGIVGIWLSFLSSGIHASIAGVLIAATIPARTRIDERTFAHRLKDLTDEFLKIPPNNVTLLEPDQMETIGKIEQLTRSAETPLQRLEHNLAPLVGLVVMPIFALANAGVPLGAEGIRWLGPVTSGVFLGLVAGKWLGVVGATWLVTRWGGATMPEGMTTRHLVGAGFLCGIGFTMSMFITSLAFDESLFAEEAKIGIVVASLVAALLAVLVLWRRQRSNVPVVPLA